MAYRRTEPTKQRIKADLNIINFRNYDDFLLSLGTDQDKCYLESDEVTRQIAEFGFRSADEPMTREDFEKRVAAVHNYINPPHRPYVMASEKTSSDSEQILVELAMRERANRVGIMSTIIFLRSIERGVEISGYIDYAHRLGTEDWEPIFLGRKKIRPTVKDLGYFNWQSGKVISNNSVFYRKQLTDLSGDHALLPIAGNMHTWIFLVENTNRKIRMYTNRFQQHEEFRKIPMIVQFNYKTLMVINNYIRSYICQIIRAGSILIGHGVMISVKCTQQHGLIFQHVYDRLTIMADPKRAPGENTRRKKIVSDVYEQVHLLDHVVRHRS